MSDFDRQLVSLITELTDEGLVWPLRNVVDHWGRERTKRVIADGFAVIRRNGTDLDDGSFVATEDADVVIDHLRRTDDYLIIAEPWAPIGPEDEPNLVLRYAADEPRAVAEMRRRHAERRAELCR